MRRNLMRVFRRTFAGILTASLLIGNGSVEVLAENEKAAVEKQQYVFAEDYNQQQGPVWKYCWKGEKSGETGEMTWHNGNQRWEENQHNNHWMRIFQDGMMSGNDGCSAVIEWTAPKAGMVLITAGALEAKVSENEIAMEEDRKDRDGATMRVEHNDTTIWGGCSTLNNRKHLAFDPIRVSVQPGDKLRFVENGDGGKQGYDNDRVYWNPIVTYETEENGVLLKNGQMISGEEVVFDVANLEQVNAGDVTVFAAVNGALRTEVEVTSVFLDAGKLHVEFSPIAEQNAQIELSVLVKGTSAMVKYNTADYTKDQVEVTSEVVGNGGSISPNGITLVQKGESVTFTFETETEYELYRLWMNDELQDIDKVVSKNQFTVENVQDTVHVKAAFRKKGEKRGTTYFVDAKDGNDSNSGTSKKKAWKSLEKVNETTFQPGDQILLKAGCTWNGYLWPKGEGDELDPITLGKYGDKDSYPIINGNGTMPYDWPKKGGEATYTPTVMLSDQSYWVIEGLEVTNNFNTTYNQVGILVWTTGRNGETKEVTVQECYVHDVTATGSNNKMTGGILGVGSDFWLDGNPIEETIQAERGFNGLYFVNNHVKNVQKEGVRTTGLGEHFRNQKEHVDVVIRGNYIEEVYGDGIVLAEVGQAGLVESNVVKNACNVSEANYAGAWSWQCDDTIYRYNEVFGIEYGYNDGEAFDFDIGCKNHAFVYNYSHNNKGGLLLTMYSSPTYTFAYNISANDGKPSQELFHCAVGDEYIYNNTIYVGKGISTNLFNNGNVGFFKNNIVLVHGNLMDMFSGSGSLNENGVANNIFYPASITEGMSETLLQKNLTVDPVLPGASLSTKEDYALSTGLTYQTMGQGEEWLNGFRERASIFKLSETSPAIDAGVQIEDPNFTLTGDLFGNPIRDAVDIGAHEYNKDPGPVDENVKKPESIHLNQNDIYLLTGDKKVLKAEAGPADALDTSVVYESSKPEVASVSVNGTIVGNKEGTAVITVKANSNKEIQAQCTVHVYARNGQNLIAVKDGYVRDNGKNDGAANNIFVKNDVPGWSSKGLVGFDLTGMNADFVNAVLQFYVLEGQSDVVEATVFDVSGQVWDEETMNWDNAPKGQEEFAKIFVSSADAGKWISIDMTDYLKEKIKQGEKEISFLIEGTGALGGRSQFKLASRENTGNEPVIKISNDSILSVESVSVNTAVGKAPALPKMVKATGIDGKVFDAEVKWDKIDSEKYKKEGQFTATGKIDGYSMPVVATIRVSDSIILETAETQCSTPVGIAPILPDTIEVTYITGKTGQAKVVWENVDENSYANPGSFEVKGKIEGFAENVVVKVTVTEAVPVVADTSAVNGMTGYEPLLPVEVNVRYSDGSMHKESVVWDALSKESWKKDGAFEVKGVAKSGCEAICIVTMCTATVEEGMTIDNPQGKYPDLPRTVVMKSGDQIFEMLVSWESVPAEAYKGAEDFEVAGVVAGTKIPVTAKVHQIDAIQTNRSEVAATEDVKIQAAPSDSNFAGELTLNVKNTTYDKKYKRDSIVKFDLSAVDGGWQNLTGMKLKLYLTAREERGEESYLSVWASGSNWSEETASWDGITQSGYKKVLLAENVPVHNDQVGSYIEIDVTNALPYVENGLITFALGIEKNPEENIEGDHIALTFASEEAGLETAPKLEVTNRYITEMEVLKTEVQQGYVPELPEKVQVTFSDGEKVEVDVIWDSMNYSMFSEPGVVYVAGTAEKLYTTVAAEVTVKASVADKTELNKLIEHADSLREKDYTAKSWKKLQKVLSEAKEVRDDEEATQTKVERAVKQLEKALANLEKVTGNGGSSDEENGTNSGQEQNKNGSKTPNTSDSSVFLIWIMMLVISGMLFATVKKYRKHYR